MFEQTLNDSACHTKVFRWWLIYKCSHIVPSALLTWPRQEFWTLALSHCVLIAFHSVSFSWTSLAVDHDCRIETLKSKERWMRQQEVYLHRGLCLPNDRIQCKNKAHFERQMGRKLCQTWKSWLNWPMKAFDNWHQHLDTDRFSETVFCLFVRSHQCGACLKFCQQWSLLTKVAWFWQLL